jgi:hypothetical protein
MQKNYVSASELAEYIYCECCWIDKMEGLQIQTLAMQKGTAEHDRIQGHYMRSLILMRIAILIILLGIIALIILLFFNLILNISLWKF